MAVEVMLPSLGEDASEVATVSRWLVQEGAVVEKGNDLVEMTTDKAAFNVPSPATGTVVKIAAQEGADVQVGALICVIE